MKISVNWLKQYLDIPVGIDRLSEILTDIGLEVEGVSSFESIPGGLNGLVVGHVLSTEKHPDADKLKVTQVDVGADEHLSIVCGAPNVDAGQKVIIATVGTTIYPLTGEPFKIKKAKIRGQESFGMICAEDEIGLGEGHDGIMVLPDDVAIGSLAKDHFNVHTDTVIEIGLTPNRSDAISHLGVARDLKAYFNSMEDGNLTVKVPSIDDFNEGAAKNLKVKIEDLAACPRYTGLLLSNVTVGESPEWLKQALDSIGLRPINNIVDITNFVMHETGQPLHAFDAEKISSKEVRIKMLAEGTPFITLDEIERKLKATDLMICNADEPMCIAGVFGGINSGVHAETKSIFLESAFFNATTIRKTAAAHHLKTDASYRFERGADVNMTPYAIKRAALLMQELASATIASSISDVYPNKIENKTIEVSIQRIQSLIGLAIPTDKIKEILTQLEYTVADSSTGNLKIEIPAYRADVLREADIVEEVLRIYGFNNIPIDTKLKSSIVIQDKPDKNGIRNHIANQLAGAGLQEILNNSLANQVKVTEIFGIPEEQQVNMLMSENAGLSTMRPNLLISGLESIAHNLNRSNKDLKFFELGSSYLKTANGFEEEETISILLTGKRDQETWLANAKKKSDFFYLKSLINNCLLRVGIKKYQVDDQSIDSLAYGLSYNLGKFKIANMGAVKPSILKAFGIKQAVFYAELHMKTIFQQLKNAKLVYHEIPKFPSMRRDLSLVIDKSISYKAIEKIAKKNGKQILTEVEVFDVYQDEKLGADKKAYAIAYVFRSPDKTLTDEEVDAVMNPLMGKYESELKAVIRR